MKNGISVSSDELNFLSKSRALCAESPLWDYRCDSICWTDIDGRSLHSFDLNSKTITSKQMPGRVGCIILRKKGGYIAAMESKIVALDSHFNISNELGCVNFCEELERFNDGKADRSGSHFWVGSIHFSREKKAGIWRFSSDNSLVKVFDGIDAANGIAWSPDGTIMYFADSWRRIIWAVDYDIESGEISNRREFFCLRPEMGRPDGAAVDSDGYYWCAAFGASRILRISPDGILDREIEIPVLCPTMPSFGGADLRELYVTSFGDEKKIPELAVDLFAGSVFSLKLDVKGLPEPLMDAG